ncbi:MAG TPA: acyl-CoA reductase [Salinivirgaceae bacterium]|nr:acyl-CoA reductase [Salinivirgaceae bacterium]HQA76558.1 acyl-CoA reductase [Salinivirgaceae bacterium]
MKPDYIIDALDKLGSIIKEFLLISEEERVIKCPELSAAVLDCHKQNSWFVKPFVINSLEGVSQWLNKNTLWNFYNENKIEFAKNPKTIGLIMAGNIPLVGFHDFLAVLLTGHKAIVKLSSKDTILLPTLVSNLEKDYPEIIKRIYFVQEMTNSLDALIATGTNNTMNYFSYKYGQTPSILRGSRSSVAILTGKETAKQIEELTKDICLYFGMGCRSVAKIYMPDEKSIKQIQDSLSAYYWMTNHKDWSDNLRFQKAMMLTRGEIFYDCGPVIMVQESKLSSPMSVVHFEIYKSIEEVKNSLKALNSMVQCVVGDTKINNSWVPFGKSQYPDINDFADGINTCDFIMQL